MSEEAEELERAQATLLRKREELQAAERRRLEKRSGLGDAATVLEAIAEPAVEVPRMSLCGCGARLWGPEREQRKCSVCAAAGARASWRARLLERVPLEFRWADLSRPMVPPGGDPKTPVVTEDGRKAAAEWVASKKRIFTVVGAQSGTGKTTLVGGVGAHWAAAGLEFVWVHATELDASRPDHEAQLRRVLRAKRVILDGIGQDLGTARGDTGVSSQRAPGVLRFIVELHQGRGPEQAALTVDMTRAELEASYGGGLRRRIAANSASVQVLKLTRPKMPDYVEF